MLQVSFSRYRRTKLDRSESTVGNPDLRIRTTDYTDLALFVSNLQDAKFFFIAYYFLKIHLHNFSKIKSHQEVTKQ
jgi:hypothetical protein